MRPLLFGQDGHCGQQERQGRSLSRSQLSALSQKIFGEISSNFAFGLVISVKKCYTDCMTILHP